MARELDIEDERFEALLSDKRHKELTGSLRAIASHLSSKDDKEVVEAIRNQGEKIGELVKAIKEIPIPEKPEKPEVNIELNQDKLVTLLGEICIDIVASNNKVIEALENRLLPDSFELIKNYGVTQSVKVNYKPANQMAVKK